MCASSTLSLHACMYVLIVVCSHVSMHKLAPVYTRNYGAPRERKRERYIYMLYHNITRAKQNKTGIHVIQAYVHAGANPHELDPPQIASTSGFHL